MDSIAMPLQGAGLDHVANPGLLLYNHHAVQAVKELLREAGINQVNSGGSKTDLRMFLRERFPS